MKMSAELAAAFNEHIAAEFFSSYSYFQMAAYCDSAHLPGMATWFRMQAEEEWGHAKRFYDYALERGSDIVLQAVAAPRSNYASTLEVFEEALRQERSVSERIRALFRLAQTAGDFPCYSLLQWFMDEQVEEESSLELIVSQISRAGENGAALMMLDNELGTRSKPVDPPGTR